MGVDARGRCSREGEIDLADQQSFSGSGRPRGSRGRWFAPMARIALKARREGTSIGLQKPATVSGAVRHGMVMMSDYLVYTCQEFVKMHKHTESSVGVKVITRRNEDMTTEKLCLVRCGGPRKLRLFLEESTDFMEQLLREEMREGQAMDLHKCLVGTEIKSLDFGLRADQRMQVISFAEVQEEARKLEKLRLVAEAAGTGASGTDGGVAGYDCRQKAFSGPGPH